MSNNVDLIHYYGQIQNPFMDSNSTDQNDSSIISDELIKNLEKFLKVL